MRKVLAPLIICIIASTTFAHDKFPIEKLNRHVKDLDVLEAAWIPHWQMVIDKDLHCWIDSEAVIEMFVPQKAREDMIEIKRLKDNKWQIDISHLVKRQKIYERTIPKSYYKINKIIWDKR